jgi:hypothetical protein
MKLSVHFLSSNTPFNIRAINKIWLQAIQQILKYFVINASGMDGDGYSKKNVIMLSAVRNVEQTVSWRIKEW